MSDFDQMDDIDPSADDRPKKSRPIDPIKCLEFIQRNATKMAQAKANRVYIEESLRSVKATVMQQHSVLPVNGQEREAYASEPYKAALDGLKAAVEAEEQLRWMMVAAQAKVDVWRSLERSNRAMDRGTR